MFNTPNDKSLPGYLKMGWQEVGRLPVVVRPNRWRFPFVVATARRPATRDAIPTGVGVPAHDALGGAHADAIETRWPGSRPVGGSAPATGPPPSRGGSESRASATAWSHDGDPAHGFAIFRLRRRGSAVEAVVSEVLAAGRRPTPSGRAASARVAAASADYLIRLGSDGVTTRGFVRLPHMGPVLVCRSLGNTAVPTNPRAGR